MEKHVTSLELSKRLKELGAPQKSEFYWCPIPKIGENGKSYFDSWDIQHKDHMRYFGKKIRVSAFLTSELGEIMKSKGMGVVAYSSIQGKWWCSGGKWDAGKQAYDGLQQSDTMQDALGLMLEYLIQNKMIGGI